MSKQECMELLNKLINNVDNSLKHIAKQLKELEELPIGFCDYIEYNEKYRNYNALKAFIDNLYKGKK